jgi:hypothetical protein
MGDAFDDDKDRNSRSFGVPSDLIQQPQTVLA